MTRVNKIVKSLWIICLAVVSAVLIGAMADKVDATTYADATLTITKIETIADATYNATRQAPNIIVKQDENIVNESDYTLSIKYKKIGEDDSAFVEIAESDAYTNAGVYKITASVTAENATYLPGSVSTTYTINKANVSDEQFKYVKSSITKNSNDPNFTNELTNLLELPVVYTVTTDKGIKVSASGEITLALNAEEKTEVSVSANFEGNDNFNAKRASYSLIVNNKVTITWIVDGVQKTQDFAYNQKIEYQGTTPTKSSTTEFDYAFEKWLPEVAEDERAVTDKTFTASFKESKRKYEIKFLWEDGSLMRTYILEYGVMPTWDEPTKTGGDECKYKFTGWSPEVTIVRGEASYTANFEKRLLNVKSEAKAGEDSVAEIVSTNGIYDKARFIAEANNEISFATPKNCENIASYTAKLVVPVEGGNLVPMYLGEKVTVKVKLAEVPSKTTNIKVAMEDAEGEIELIDCVIDGDYLTFETNKISDFMIVKDCGNLLATCLISFAFILVAVMVLTVILVPVLKKQDHTTYTEYSEDEKN